MIFKRSLALILAVLQVAFAFPFSGAAAAQQVLFDAAAVHAQPQIVPQLGNVQSLSIPGIEAGRTEIKTDLSGVDPALPVLDNAQSLERAVDDRSSPAEIQRTEGLSSSKKSIPEAVSKKSDEAAASDAGEIFERMARRASMPAAPAVSAPSNSGLTAAAPLDAPVAQPNVGPSAASVSVPSVPSAPPVVESSKWRLSPAVRWTAAAAAAAGFAFAAPFLAAHAEIVGYAGSGVLAWLGIPQIGTVARGKQEGTKDYLLAGPLIWFAAASLLSLVSFGQHQSIPWLAANLAGVIESAVVIGQLNYFRRDAKTLKPTLAAAAGVGAGIALIASQALMPLAAGLRLAFAGAMVLLGTLDLPQIRRNYEIFAKDNRPPTGISQTSKGMVVVGSALHLFNALVVQNYSWAFNAAIAILTAGTVLGQMYLPRAANAVVGPVVRAVDGAVHSIQNRAALFEARRLVAREFRGSDYLKFKSENPAESLAAIDERVKRLPGRSVILLEAPTSAGKSTLSEQIHKAIEGRVVAFPVDNYFKAPQDIPSDPQGRPDYDQPNALYLDRAAQDLKTLLMGGRIELPKKIIDGPVIWNSGNFLRLGWNDVIVVDSIFASHPKFLEAAKWHKTLNVYLAAPAAVRFARRLKRDRTERGVSVQKNIEGWGRLLENERAHILPLREKADVVLNLVGEPELKRLPDTLAEILAQEWQAQGRDPQTTDLFLRMVRASIEADRSFKPVP